MYCLETTINVLQDQLLMIEVKTLSINFHVLCILRVHVHAC